MGLGFSNLSLFFVSSSLAQTSQLPLWRGCLFFKGTGVKCAMQAFCGCTGQKLVKPRKKNGEKSMPLVATLPLTVPGCGHDRPDLGPFRSGRRRLCEKLGLWIGAVGCELWQSHLTLCGTSRPRGLARGGSFLVPGDGMPSGPREWVCTCFGGLLR